MLPSDERAPGPSPAPAGVAATPRRRQLGMLLVLVFALALLLRLIYAFEIRDLPTLHELVMDAQRYDALARQILDHGWWPREPFYQAPLYPYLLAAVYALSGRSLLAVRLAQSVLGALTAVLAALAAARAGAPEPTATGRRPLPAAALSGVLAALYAPAVFYTPLLLKTVPALFFESAALVLLLPPPGRGFSARRGLAAGLALGAAALLQESLLLLVPAAALFVLAAAPIGEPAPQGLNRRRAAAALALVAGAGLAVAPAALANYSAGGELLVSSVGGMNFYIGNARRATGTYAALSNGNQAPERQREDARRLAAAFESRQRGRVVAPAELNPGQVSRIFWRQALHEIAADPVAWLRLLLHKTRLFWNAYEIPDSEGFRVYRSAAAVLRFDPVVFGLLAPLAAVGLLALARGTPAERRSALLLAMLAAAASASVVLFFIFGRYRLAVVPFLLPPAAAGPLELIALARVARAGARGSLRRLTLDLALLAGTALAVDLPCFPAAEIRQQDAVIEYNLGTAAIRWAETSYAKRQHPATAVMLASRAAGYLEAAARASPGFFAAELEWATALARRGSYLTNAGRPGLGLADYTAARRRLATVMAKGQDSGNPELDRAARSLLTSLDAGTATALNNLGVRQIEAGQLDRAEATLSRAAQLAPDLPGPRGSLALCWLRRGLDARGRGAPAEARDLFQSSRRSYRQAIRFAMAQHRDDLAALYRQGLAMAEGQLAARYLPGPPESPGSPVPPGSPRPRVPSS